MGRSGVRRRVAAVVGATALLVGPTVARPALAEVEEPVVDDLPAQLRDGEELVEERTETSKTFVTDVPGVNRGFSEELHRFVGIGGASIVELGSTQDFRDAERIVRIRAQVNPDRNLTLTFTLIGLRKDGPPPAGGGDLGLRRAPARGGRQRRQRRPRRAGQPPR